MLAGAGEQFGGGRRRGGTGDRQPSVVDHPVRVERLAAANGGEGRQQRADRQAGGLAQDALQRSLNLTDCSIADLAYAVVRGVRVAVRLRSGASPAAKAATVRRMCSTLSAPFTGNQPMTSSPSMSPMIVTTP